MKLRYIAILLTVVILRMIFPEHILAQRKSNRIIATDYNECMMGIKDTLGNWVVEPKYERIRWANQNRFFVTTNAMEGLIDSNGRVLISPMYINIESTVLEDYYEVTQWKGTGVVDVANHIVIPLKCNKVVTTSDTVFFAEVKRREWLLYHKDGTFFKVPGRTNIRPYQVGKHQYRIGKDRPLFKNQFGLIDDSARTIAPCKFDAIYESSVNGLVILRNGYDAYYMNASGQFAWPHPFRFRSKSVSYGSNYWFDSWDMWGPDQIFESDTIGVARVGDKCGLITASGRTLLPFVYDDIYSAFESNYLNSSTWITDSSGQRGIYNCTSGWMIKNEYQYIVDLNGMNIEGDSAIYGVFAGMKNGYWGAATTTGQVIIPFVFTGMHKDWGYHTVFYNADTVVQLDLNGYKLRKQLVANALNLSSDTAIHKLKYSNIQSVPHQGVLSSYSNGNGTTVFYHPGHIHDTLRISDQPVFTRNISVDHIPDSIIVASCIVVNTLEPALIMPGGHVVYNGISHSVSRNFVYDAWVLHKNDTTIDEVRTARSDGKHTYYYTVSSFLYRDDGKVLCEPDSWREIREMQCDDSGSIQFLARDTYRQAVIDTSGNFIIAPVKGEIGAYSNKYVWIHPCHGRGRFFFCNRKWKLIDRRTGKPEAVKMRPYYNIPSTLWNDMTALESTKNGFRLYSLSEDRFVTKEGYNNIKAVNDSGTTFLVRTCSGKLGLINKLGEMILDTCWTNCTPLHYSSMNCELSDWGTFRSVEAYYKILVFSNDSSSIVFDVTDNVIAGDSIVTQYFYESMAIMPDTEKINTARINQRFQRISFGSNSVMMYESDTAKLSQWQLRILVDSLTRSQRLQEDKYRITEGMPVYQCEYCRKKTGMWHYEVPDPRGNKYFIHHIGDSVLTYWALVDGYNMIWHTNLMLFADSTVRKMTLDSLFNPNTDWRNFIINSVLNYVNNHLYIEGDCHNPSAFPVMLNDRYLITESGIELYPTEFYENHTQLVILIPWSAADPYLRADIRSKVNRP